MMMLVWMCALPLLKIKSIILEMTQYRCGNIVYLGILRCCGEICLQNLSSFLHIRLLGLLLLCAECVAMDNLNNDDNLLPEIAELSSPFGSLAERVAAYFAEAL